MNEPTHEGGEQTSTFKRDFSLPSTSAIVKRWSPLVLGIGILVVVVALGVSMALRSLPGDVLYPLKLQGESLYGDVTKNADSRASYEIYRVEERFGELKSLHEAGGATESGLAQFTVALDDSTAAFIDALELAKGEGIAPKEILILGAHYTSAARAIELLAEGDSAFASIEEVVENSRSDAENYFEDQAEYFAEVEGPRVITEYLTEMLTRAQQNATKEGMGGKEKVAVRDLLASANRALADGNLFRAFRYASEADRVVVSAGYLAGIEFEKEPSQPRDTPPASTTPEAASTTSPG